jgi:hypothetical protein
MKIIETHIVPNMYYRSISPAYYLIHKCEGGKYFTQQGDIIEKMRKEDFEHAITILKEKK